MTSVAPPPPPPPPTGNANAAQLVVTPNAQAAVVLSKLALDSLLSGLIKPSLSPQGETILQTSLGALPFKAPFNLPPNIEATFKLIQIEPALQMQLTHLAGKPVPPQTSPARLNILAQQLSPNPSPLQSNTGALLSGQQQGGVQNNTAMPATTLSVNNAQGIKAFVLPTGAPPTATAGSQTLQNTASSPSASQGQGVLKGATFPGQAGPQPSQAGIQNVPINQSTQNTPFQSGNQLSVRLINVQLPNQTTSGTQLPPAVLSSSTVITQGTVQGQTSNGHPVINLPEGRIALETTTKFPDGTQIKLEVLSSIKPSDKPVVTPLQSQDGLTTSLSQKWPALDEALSSLKEINPALADHLINTVLPKPDARLALNMIFFLKALGRGSFKNWIDDKSLRAIARSKPELLKKLDNDFSQLSDKAKQPNSTDWKIAYIPVHDQNKLQQIRIAQRDHKDEDSNAKEDPGVRFVIDLNLSNLGAMQFDGLARERAKRFDLIIRTHNALPGFIRRDIHDIYAHGMDAVGFDGKISFQVTSHFVQVEEGMTSPGTLNLGMLV